MWTTTAAFASALAADQRQWSTKVEVLYGSDVVQVFDVVQGGTVTLDSVAVRRELNVAFVDADGALTPTSARDLMAPKGTEIRVSRGLLIPATGAYEYVPLGVFGVTKPEVRASQDGVILAVKGLDRVDAVRVRRFTDPWTVNGGTLVSTAIANIVTSRLPNVAVKITPTPYTTPEVVFDRLSDPWDAVRTLAENAAMQAFFDPLGSLVVGPAGGVETGVTYATATSTSTLLNVTRSMDASNTYSGVIVRGENPDQPTVAVTKWDTDPASATYSDGPFGRRPYGYFSQFLTSQAQAQAVADALFTQKIRMSTEVEIATVGTPAHDVDDILSIVDTRSRTNGRFQIISATIPLRAAQGELLRWRCKGID